MSETNVSRIRRISIRHRGRPAQIPIYLGKFLRMFIYQSDWKVLPMSAVIAGLVGMVIQNRLFVSMEGTLMGGFALVMVCIWNGCFNSIQAICRERDVIKREHRSGMHVSSYIAAHMIYQGILCLAQTVITLYVTKTVGVRYPAEGLFSSWYLLDFGVTMFLITFASDMLSLWVSSLVHSTTTAMTVMPFILIFQLVFSGGMLTLPGWAKSITPLTISNPALNVTCAQADYNHQPLNAVWNQLNNMRDREISVTITQDQVIGKLQEKDNPAVQKIRDTEIKDGVSLGTLVDLIAEDPEVAKNKDLAIPIQTTVGNIIDLIGEDRVKEITMIKIAESNTKPEYDCDPYNIMGYWFRLGVFALVFAALAVITLEFIDRDKR